MEFLPGARPIDHQELTAHYQCHRFQSHSLGTYAECWREWLTVTEDKKISGLAGFGHADFTHGSSQTFDHFVLRHAQSREIVTLPGEFQYHRCITKTLRHRSLDPVALDIHKDSALIISVPFSDYGTVHPKFQTIMDLCESLAVPVCLDISYWGVARNCDIDLDRWQCIEQVTSSLSKPFGVLNQHRVGVRFARAYLDDGISMMNQVGAVNHHSMSLGIHFMREFGTDWNWSTHGDRYQDLVNDQGLTATDTVLFAASSDDKYQKFCRGNPGHYRLCVADNLAA